MVNPTKDILALRESAKIKKAQLASSPYVLRKVFAADPTIHRLIGAGQKVAAMVSDEIRKPEPLDEISLAALAYVIENIDVQAAPKVLGPAFRKAMKKPGPFFVHFAAHAIRHALSLPVKPPEIVYSRAELTETLDMLR